VLRNENILNYRRVNSLQILNKCAHNNHRVGINIENKEFTFIIYFMYHGVQNLITSPHLFFHSHQFFKFFFHNFFRNILRNTLHQRCNTVTRRLHLPNLPLRITTNTTSSSLFLLTPITIMPNCYG
jgi:hypothetical protein